MTTKPVHYARAMTTSRRSTDAALDQRTVSLSRWTASVVDLLEKRSDLHGVAPMADLVYDATRWSA
jgi:hypothetical protein